MWYFFDISHYKQRQWKEIRIRESVKLWIQLQPYAKIIFIIMKPCLHFTQSCIIRFKTMMAKYSIFVSLMQILLQIYVSVKSLWWLSLLSFIPQRNMWTLYGPQIWTTLQQHPPHLQLINLYIIGSVAITQFHPPLIILFKLLKFCLYSIVFVLFLC
jgi:hypothetical protein